MKEIYFAAQSLPVEAQAKYLDEHCKDAGMRRDVEKLLGESTESATHAMLDSLVPPDTVTAPLPPFGPGAQLGHYRIKRRLGTGGMSWVFEAFDESLLRTVAIKVLTPGKDDAPMRRRLLREAQAASALNHPNIVTVHEVGRIGETDFIAMERIVGRTLRQIVGHSGLDVKTTLRYAAQIADALAAAHDAKIVHRDLKPGNIMVNERGLLKVLDFGIAKQMDRVSSPASSSDLSISHSGEVIGTFSYMSPEQAQGHAVDARSDIFSFGSVLYEMLSGRRAFLGDTVLETVHAILTQEPEPLPPLPRALERVVTKCLQKKAIDRWQDMSDVKQILQDLLRDFDLPAEENPGTPVSLRRWRWIALCAAALAAGAVAFVAAKALTGRGGEARSILRRVTADGGVNTAPALSRDGKFLAFASDRAGRDDLDIWILPVGGGEPSRLTSTPADETDPSFSPDATHVAYQTTSGGGAIYSVSAFGGVPILIARNGRGPRYSPDGRSIAYWTGEGVFVVDAAGGAPRRVHPEMSLARSPVWSPKGDALLVYGVKDNKTDWWVLPLNAGAPVQTGAFGAIDPVAPLDWIDDGLSRVLYPAAAGEAINLWELPLASSYAALSPARPVTHGPGNHRHGSVATDITAFAEETETSAIWQLPLDAKSEPRRISGSVEQSYSPSLSADGRQLAFLRATFGSFRVVARDTGGERERVLAMSPLPLPGAHVTPDFQHLVYTTSRHDLAILPVAGGAPEVLCPACGTVTGASPDGAYVLYEPVRDPDLLVYDAAAKKTLQLAQRPGPGNGISAARFSRDGKWIAFLHDSRVYALPFKPKHSAPFAEWIAVSEEAHQALDPVWASAGDLIYFTSDRDGFRCIWARRLDAITKRPIGESFPIRHFHSARQSLQPGRFPGLSAAADRLAFTLTEASANIWLEIKNPSR